MGLSSSVELALANLYLNEPMLELVTFDDEWSSSTRADVDLGLDIEDEEDGGESSGNGGDFDDFDKEDYQQ